MDKPTAKERFPKSVYKALRAFIIVYGTRHGISLLLDVLKRKPFAWNLLYHNRALKSAIFLSWFTFAYAQLRNQTSKINTFMAGAVAGLGVYFESKSNRIAFTQQTTVRSLNGLYQVMLNHGYRKLPYIYESIFSVSSGVVMYGFVMHPETLPHSLIHFMVNMSNTPYKMLDFCRSVANRSPIDLIKFKEWIHSKKGTQLAQDTLQQLIESSQDPNNAILSQIPIKIQHFTMESSFKYTLFLFYKTFKDILPVYAGLHILPRFFLNFQSFIKS